MHVLVASDQWSPDAVGGSARVAADTARALAARGHTVTALVPQRNGAPSQSFEEGVAVCRLLTRGRLPQTLIDPLATWHAARRQREKVDVLVGHQATTAVGLAAAHRGVPLALVFHASATLEGRYLRERTHGPRQLVLRGLQPANVALERRSVAQATRILVLSAFSRDLLTDLHPIASTRVRQVSGGIEPRFLAPPTEIAAAVKKRIGVPEGDILVLTTRRLEPRMGLEQLLAAVAEVDTVGITLAVTGDGSYRTSLERLAADLRIDDRVRFIGRIGDEELRSLYGAADLYVLPTLAYEGFGMSTVEALACGTPVLGTAVGATPEILAPLDPALVVTRATTADLADGIRRIVPLLGSELRARCAAYAAAQYDWGRVITDWEEVLEEAAIDGR